MKEINSKYPPSTIGGREFSSRLFIGKDKFSSGSPGNNVIETIRIGADAVLVNTAVAVSHDPVEIAKPFRLGVKARPAAGQADRSGSSSTAGASSSALTGCLK